MRACSPNRAMRSPSLTASVTSCVTSTMVLRILAWRSRNSSWSRSRVIGSMAPNGSSISITGGSAANARATPTRCCCPPDSSLGWRRRNVAGSRPTRSSSVSTRSRTRFLSQPRVRGMSPMLSATVKCGKRPTCWMTYPIRRRSWSGSARVTSSPSRKTRPVVGSISRLIRRRVVVLPQPDGPRSTTISPAAMSRDNSATAGAAWPGYCLLTRSSRIIGSVMRCLATW